jgi:hypothetical protein
MSNVLLEVVASFQLILDLVKLFGEDQRSKLFRIECKKISGWINQHTTFVMYTLNTVFLDIEHY